MAGVHGFPCGDAVLGSGHGSAAAGIRRGSRAAALGSPWRGAASTPPPSPRTPPHLRRSRAPPSARTPPHLRRSRAPAGRRACPVGSSTRPLFADQPRFCGTTHVSGGDRCTIWRKRLLMTGMFLWPVPCCARDLAVLMAFAHGRCRHPHMAGSGICSQHVSARCQACTFEAGTAVSCSVVGAGWPGRTTAPI